MALRLYLTLAVGISTAVTREMKGFEIINEFTSVSFSCSDCAVVTQKHPKRGQMKAKSSALFQPEVHSQHLDAHFSMYLALYMS